MPTAPTSPYWFQRDDTGQPYRIPLCHNSFVLTETQTPPRSFRATLGALIGNNNVVAAPRLEIRDVRLESSNGVATLRSKSYGPGDVRPTCCIDPASAALNEDIALTLPLTVNAGVAAAAVWDTNTNFSWTMTPAHRARIDVFPHGGGGSVANSVKDFAWLLDNWNVGHNAAGIQFRCTLHDLLTALGNPDLFAQRNPYKLQVSLIFGDLVRALGWTYFHVPSVKEVTFLETYRTQRILPKGGAMTGFDAFGAGSVVQASLDDPGIVNFVANPPALTQPISAHENFLYPTRRELEDIVAQLNAPTIDRSLQDARTRLAGADRFEGERRRMTELGARNDIRKFEAMQPNVQRLREAGANVDDAGERATLGHLRDYDQNSQNIIIRRAGGCFVQMSWGSTAVFLRRNGNYYLKRLYMAAYLTGTNRSLCVLDAAGNLAAFGAANAVPAPAAHDAPQAVRMAHAATVQTVATQANFHNRGALLAANTNWAYVELPDNDDWLMEQAVTYGVSSCSASWMFPDQDAPDAIVFAHIDNNAAPPIEHAVQWLIAAGLVNNTDFKCINFMLPQMEEVEKFSQPVVFPGGAGGLTFESILCPRETHLGDTHSGQFNRGYDAVGVSFENGGTEPALSGVYGPRSYQPTALVNHTGESQRDACLARRTLRDATRHVYGTTPATIGGHNVGAVPAWQTFLRTIHHTVQTEERMRGAGGTNPYHLMRTEILRQRKVFRLRQAGRRLYAAMRGAAACQQLSAKGILIISDDQQHELEHR